MGYVGPFVVVGLIAVALWYMGLAPSPLGCGVLHSAEASSCLWLGPGPGMAGCAVQESWADAGQLAGKARSQHSWLLVLGGVLPSLYFQWRVFSCLSLLFFHCCFLRLIYIV